MSMVTGGRSGTGAGGLKVESGRYERKPEPIAVFERTPGARSTFELTPNSISSSMMQQTTSGYVIRAQPNKERACG